MASEKRLISNPEIRIGVDTGGTFTDFVIWKDGEILNRKILSTPNDPSQAILQGIREFLLESGISVFIIHGTTVATNSLLEKKGGPMALITTKGFEDILAIGRQTRKNLYSLRGEARPSLLPSSLCFGVEERTLASGGIEKKVDRAGLNKILRRIKKTKVSAVAVSLIHSYANPANEEKILRELERENMLASVSSRLLPEYREYERTSTTAVNAYLMPVMNKYIGELERNIRGAELRIMQSNEGYISPAKARLEPIKTALSGPAGGVVGAAQLAKAAGFPNIISFDMGGTSTDVSLIEGRIRRTHECLIGDFPVRLPIIDIHSVGAGGGSIAYVDSGGSLRVGPQSAGADPGPACYGKGDDPTVTDADLFLGRLDPDFFLGGKMKIYPDRSKAVLRRLGARIGKTPLETALGIVAIANANMEKAIRLISIERGFDPRTFALFSFGGAGGMHAVEMAAHLRMPRVIVPRNAGVLSALGLLMADSIKDFSKSIMRTASEMSGAGLEKAFIGLEKESVEEMKTDGFSEKDISLERSLDLRYLGQSYEITIPIGRGPLRAASLSEAFHRAHRKLYSYHHARRAVEIVNIRVKAIGSTPKIRPAKRPEGRSTAPPPQARIKTQIITWSEKEHPGPVIDRSRLVPGNRIGGPALIIDPESTAFLPPGYLARVDGYMNLIIAQAR